MADEVKNVEEQHALPSKRKPVDSNPAGEDVAEDPTKKQKPVEDEEGDEDEHSNGAVETDPKGKGMLIEEPEPESDSDSDSTDYSLTDSDYDSDLSDDLLAEVYWESILSATTRTSVISNQPLPSLPPKKDKAGDA